MTKELARNSRNSGVEPLFGWDPFSSLFSRRPVERLFSGLPFAGLADAFDSDFGVRIVDADNLKKFQFPLPGVSKDNIQVEIVDNVLTVRVQEKNETGERTYYSRVTLSPDLDLDNVAADSKDGLLVVSIPVKEKSSRRIPIAVGDSGGALESETVKVSQPDESNAADASDEKTPEEHDRVDGANEKDKD